MRRASVVVLLGAVLVACGTSSGQATRLSSPSASSTTAGTSSNSLTAASLSTATSTSTGGSPITVPPPSTPELNDVTTAAGTAAAPPTTRADASTVADTVPDADATTLPPGAVPGLDDYDGDGQPDPTCGTQDFGGGLVLRIPCSITSAHQPSDGTTLVADSLFRLPGDNPPEFAGMSGDILQARDASGAKIIIIIFNTDALFAPNSATIASTDSMDAAIRGINAVFPAGTVQVRGHTDATGSATSNQALSERRATTVQQYLQTHGLNATSVTALGLSSTQPLTLETNPDGSANLAGRTFNRRVEIVVRVS